MKKIILLSGLFLSMGIFSAFSPVTPTFEAPSWEIDAVHSSVTFSVRHYFSDVVGSFDEFEGTLKFDPENPDESSVSFSVSVGSVNTKNERRDGHLQSEDFFNAEKWPQMTFTSSSISKQGDKYMAKGQLTIRDVTKEVEVPINFLGEMAHPRDEGKYIGGFSSEFTINRTDYGVGVGNFAATTTIGDEVTVKINIEASRAVS